LNRLESLTKRWKEKQVTHRLLSSLELQF
jgi:hypothetical protein